MPTSITCVAVFCDEPLFSVPPNSAGLVSIVVQGYVQAKHATVPSTMKNWIDSPTWEPIPGGLTSNNDFMTNMRRFNDPTDLMTQLMVFGRVGANNAGRNAEGQARKVNESNHILTFKIVSSNGLRRCAMLFFLLNYFPY